MSSPEQQPDPAPDPALDPSSPGWGPEDQGARPGVPLGRADQQPPPGEVREKSADQPE